jgi:hypothetical protein
MSLTMELTDVTELDSGCLRIADPDAPIYRIFPLWFFEEALRRRQLVLSTPRRWEDPFEVLPWMVRIGSKNADGYRQQSFSAYLDHVYAQCWSNTKESDTLIRAYSRVVMDPHHGRNTCPRDEGVRVRSTARKLLRALRAACEGHKDKSCFIGGVQYGDRNEIQRIIGNMIAKHGPEESGRGANMARLLLLKRDAFSHEAEVRLICVTATQQTDDVVRARIDINETFDEVSFDPRLTAFERNERVTVARSLGYEGPIVEIDLYQKTALIVDIPGSGVIEPSRKTESPSE